MKGNKDDLTYTHNEQQGDAKLFEWRGLIDE